MLIIYHRHQVNYETEKLILSIRYMKIKTDHKKL